MPRSKRKKRKERRQQNAYIQPMDLLQPIVPKTVGQEEYLDSIEDNPITICTGPAGTGKTILAFGMALQYYLSNSCIDRIVIVRSTYPAGDEPALGFLPGDMNEKMSPFLAPLLKDSARQLLKKFKKDYETQNLLNRGNSISNTASMMNIMLSKFDIEIVPLQFMRGRTFSNSFVILDEAQNCSMADFKLFLTRIGENSRVVIEGDASQKDRPDGALPELMERLSGLDTVGVVELDDRDIVRSPLISAILKRLQ